MCQMSKIKILKTQSNVCQTQTQIQTHSKINQTARQVRERRNHTHKQTRQMQIHEHQTCGATAQQIQIQTQTTI